MENAQSHGISRRWLVIGSIFMLLLACQSSSSSSDQQMAAIDWQGHRGARGLMPENSIPGFKRALELGVTTLEMDLVISQDSQVVVSHEPWLSPEICQYPDGDPLRTGADTAYNLFAMPYPQIRQFDCGSKPTPHFPEQQKMTTYKPLLREVIDSAEVHARRLGRKSPRYNLEIKRRPAWDSVFHPEGPTFVDLVLTVVRDKHIDQRSVIQSFDLETLQLVHRKAPELPLALLIENELPPAENLARLGFIPEIYSPWYQLVDPALIQLARAKDMQVIPWTVNELADMRALIELGVDGIITDYPDRAVADQDAP